MEMLGSVIYVGILLGFAFVCRLGVLLLDKFFPNEKN